MKSEKGLGTGLSALFGEAAAAEADRPECVYLAVSDVEPDEDQPRKSFDPDALAELADSIAEHGVIQPLTVRRRSGRYVIIAGERRWRAAREAGLAKIPAVVIDADDRTAAILGLVENLQREDLDPMEEASGFAALMDRFGFTQEQCAERVGKSRPAVANSLRLLGLPAEVKELVSSGKLSAGHARALLGLSGDAAMIKLAKEAVSRGLSVRQVEAAVRSASKKGGKKRSAPSIYAETLSHELTGELGRRVRIVEGAKKGRIEVEYYGNEDLDRVIAALKKIK
jgi:ParB family chromosome partitioning protein